MKSIYAWGIFCCLIVLMTGSHAAGNKWISIHKCQGGIPQQDGVALVEETCWDKGLLFSALTPSGKIALSTNIKCNSRGQPLGKKNPGSAAQQPTTEYELKKCITVGSAEVLVIDYASKPDKQAMQAAWAALPAAVTNPTGQQKGKTGGQTSVAKSSSKSTTSAALPKPGTITTTTINPGSGSIQTGGINPAQGSTKPAGGSQVIGTSQTSTKNPGASVANPNLPVTNPQNSAGDDDDEDEPTPQQSQSGNKDDEKENKKKKKKDKKKKKKDKKDKKKNSKTKLADVPLWREKSFDVSMSPYHNFQIAPSLSPPGSYCTQCISALTSWFRAIQNIKDCEDHSRRQDYCAVHFRGQFPTNQMCLAVTEKGCNMIRGPWQVYFKPLIKAILPFLPNWGEASRFATRLSRVLPRGAHTRSDMAQEKNAISLGFRLCSEITCYKSGGIDGKQCCSGYKHFGRYISENTDDYWATPPRNQHRIDQIFDPNFPQAQ